MVKIGPKEAQRRAMREAGLPEKRPTAIKPSAWRAIPTVLALVDDKGKAEVRKAIDAAIKRGRPPLKLTPEQRAERKRQQTLKRVRALRARKRKEKR